MAQSPDSPVTPPRPHGAGRVGTLIQRLVTAFSDRLYLKAAAVFFSILLWLIVSAEEPAEALVDVQFEPVIADSTTVRLRGPLPAVNALIEGPRRDLWRLRTYPPTIRRIIGAESPEQLTLRLSPLDVNVNGLPVRVHEVIPRSVTLQVEVTRSRTVPVVRAFSLRPDSGITIRGDVRMRPESVRITGPRERVTGIDSVRTERREVVVHDSGAVMLPLDTVGMGVTVSPARVEIAVPVVVDAVRHDSAHAVQPSDSAARGDSLARPDSAGTPRP